MVVTLKKTRGGSWLGICPLISSEPLAVWAGSPQKVVESELWSELRKSYTIKFDVQKSVWDTKDVLKLKPSEAEVGRWGSAKQ